MHSNTLTIQIDKDGWVRLPDLRYQCSDFWHFVNDVLVGKIELPRVKRPAEDVPTTFPLPVPLQKDEMGNYYVPVPRWTVENFNLEEGECLLVTLQRIRPKVDHQIMGD